MSDFLKVILIILIFNSNTLGQTYNIDSIVIDYPNLEFLKKKKQVHNLIAYPMERQPLEFLEYIDEELKKYPPGLLESYNIRIYLVETLLQKKLDPRLGIFTVLATYQVSDSVNEVFIVPSNEMRITVHHELSSIFFRAIQYKDTAKHNEIKRYLGYYQHVSEYDQVRYDRGKPDCNEFLGEDMYASSSAENDFNTIASHMFQPLQAIRHNGQDYTFYEFLELAIDNDFIIHEKVANAFAIYKIIDLRLNFNHFFKMKDTPVHSIQLKY
jgi:hypothetical protein